MARSILETLQEVYEQENEVQRVIGVISRLASDLGKNTWSKHLNCLNL